MYGLIADTIVILHLAFVVFVVLRAQGEGVHRLSLLVGVLSLLIWVVYVGVYWHWPAIPTKQQLQKPNRSSQT